MDIEVLLFLTLPIIISGGSVLFIKTNHKFIKLLTAFSGAYLLTISFLDIIPEIYEEDNYINPGLFILLGFFIQLFLDYLSQGIEHGHQHEHCNQSEKIKTVIHTRLQVFPVIIGLFIHSFLEGMPLANYALDPNLKYTLLTGIAIHNIPISIVLMSLLLSQNSCKIIKPIILLLLFTIASPLGVVTSQIIGLSSIEFSKEFFSITMAVVVGIFLHISTVILFETDEKHKFNYLKLGTIILGAIAAFIIA